jgi:hypothetical protein
MDERTKNIEALKQWEQTHSQVIPASRGCQVIWFRRGGFERFPVEAWRIRGEAMVPMSPALAADVYWDTDSVWAVVEPSGRVFEVDGGQRWKNVDEYVREKQKGLKKGRVVSEWRRVGGVVRRVEKDQLQ